MKKMFLIVAFGLFATACGEIPGTTMSAKTDSALAFQFADGRTEFAISEFQRNLPAALTYAQLSYDTARSSVRTVPAGIVVVAVLSCSTVIEPSAQSCRPLWSAS